MKIRIIFLRYLLLETGIYPAVLTKKPVHVAHLSEARAGPCDLMLTPLVWLVPHPLQCSIRACAQLTAQFARCDRSVQLPMIHHPAEPGMSGHTAGGTSHLMKGATEGGLMPKESPIEVRVSSCSQLLPCQVTGLAKHVSGTQYSLTGGV